ncbi:unnamed protein product [Cylicocyclus nassatus]|uniref:PHD and RING finger domain-containing protein 1 n=1 Tax=Cylicocyclus nassatus TaxID=53992 RepID=A0AA36MAX9_CYLNA|nr:unnamed protein product [Cylicocyclus nassatus]
MASPGPSQRRSSDGSDDVCPICLCPMDEGFSRPENCQHRFDLDCLTEWSKLRLSCPSCRAGFGAIYTYEIVESKPKLLKVQKMEPPKEAEPFEEANPLDFTFCEICGGGQHEELLLICDQCDKGFHTYCLTPPLDGVPATEQWFCPQCEERRISLPSTSRRATAPSARTIRFIQRTALAERVRRVLQRSRRIFDEVEETSESESADVEDEEEEEEEGELVEEDGDEESEETSEEEEVPEFFDDDARVLAEIGDDEEPALPSVQRRTKKQREAAAKKKKTTKTKKGKRKTSKRTTKGKKRRSKGKRRVRERRTRTADTKKGPLDAFVTRRGGSHDPVARLSLLGAGLEPVADDDPLITENSRRFDRPLLRRKDSRNAPSSTVAKNEAVDEEKPAADSCDLLGSIIPEQVKTLAPGRLFAIGGGRFNTTDDFEKYKERKTNLLSSELKAKLGIPVDEKDAVESKSDVSKSRDKMKEKVPSSKPDERRNVTGNSLPHGSSLGMPHRSGESTSREGTSKDLRRRDEHRMAEDKYSSSSKRDGDSYRGDRDERRRDYSDSGDSRSSRNDRIYPQRHSEERNWRDGAGDETRAGNRRWEREDDNRRKYEQPRGVVRQFGTTVRNELDPPGRVHNQGSSGRNVYEPFREMDRRPDRTIDKHSVRSLGSVRSNYERPKDDRGSSSSSNVSKLQDRRDSPNLQDRRDASRLQDRRDAPEPHVRRDSPEVQERRDAYKAKDRRDAYKPLDKRNTPELQLDRNDAPEPKERRYAPTIQEKRDAPRSHDRRDAPEPEDRRHAPTVREKKDAPRLLDRNDAPEPKERRYAPTIQEKRDAPRLHDRDAPEAEDRRHAPIIREKKDAPRLRDRGDASKLQDRRDAPELQDRGTAPIQDKRDIRRGDDRRSHERPREVSVQTSPEKPRRHERNDRVDSRSRSPRRPEQLIDEIRKNTRDLAHSSDVSGHRHSRDEIARTERPAMNKAKTEESEQEDKGSAKKPALRNAAGSLEKAENVWMPTLPSTSALAVTNAASETPATPSVTKHDEEKNSNERVKIIEGFAKEAIKQYKRDITVEEYKNVMRAVVRDCYKKRIMDGVKIKDKVDESVRAVKNGMQLDVGHHSSKRPETSGGSSVVPVKRQKISV